MDAYHDSSASASGSSAGFSHGRSPMRKIVGVIVCLLILMGILLYAYFYKKPAAQGHVSPLPLGVKITNAKKGAYPTGFPTDLNMYPNIFPVNAAVITEPGYPTQISTSFYVNTSPYLLFKQYLKALPQRGWKGTSESASGSIMSLQFTKSSTTTTQVAQIQISSSAPSVSLVEITYLPNLHS